MNVFEAQPTIDEIRKRTQSIAMLDAILYREWEYRYYSYNCKWGEGEQMASMRDGQGSFYFVLFNEQGAILKGFDLESELGRYNGKFGKPWPGLLDRVPPVFAPFLTEPAFSTEDATFCAWRERDDSAWHWPEVDLPAGDDPGGCERLLTILDGNPSTYRDWAESYYEVAVSLDAVKSIYHHDPLTNELIKALNSEATLDDLREDIAEIGYPASPDM